MICDKATNRKYRLKKKENSLYRVRGRKLQTVYLAFETALGGNRGGGYCPMLIFRDVPLLCVVPGSPVPSGPDSPDMKSGSRS